MSAARRLKKITGHIVNADCKDEKEFFPCIKKIKYNPKSKCALAFKHYNASEVIMGKTMEEWCKFAVCYWHTFRGAGVDMFGGATMTRTFDDGTESMANAKRRLCAAFEFFQKMGIKYWCFHDRDIAPMGATLEETNRNLDEIVALAKELQQRTGVKCLWGTANLFGHARYMCGAASNPDAHVFAYAAAQVKKAMEVTKELGGTSYVFWGGREGFVSYLNTNIKRELDHVAAFFRMAVEHKKKIGFTGTLLVEPKPKEPMKHQYDYDAQTVMGFLKTYGLENEFKLNIEPNHTTLAGHAYEHDIVVASQYGMLGSIDANTGSPDMGWDTDQFPMDIKPWTWIMKCIIEQGGLGTGGLNFDAKLRRESTDIQDLFIAHIAAMDTIARSLRKAATLLQDGRMVEMVRQRYASYDSGIGKKIETGATSFEELAQFVKENGEPKLTSGQQELYEAIYNEYL